MGNCVYNTSNGCFRILAEKEYPLLEALDKALKPEKPFTVLEEALSTMSFGTARNDDDDVIDVFLDSSNASEDEWNILKTVVAPFVEPGSFLVFYGDESGDVWALSFELDPDTNTVQGQEVDIAVVTFLDMYRMLFNLRSANPEVYLEMRAKYASERLQRKLDGKSQE